MKEKKIYVCSPLKGDIDTNIKKAQAYCRYVLTHGHIPIAPHIYFPQFMNDLDKEEREKGLRYGLSALRGCAEIWVFGKRLSDGMRAEVELAKKLGIKIKLFSEEMQETCSGGV